MGEAEGFMEDHVREVTGQAANPRRPLKAGDQSFWGVGLTSLGAFRMLPTDHPDRLAVDALRAASDEAARLIRELEVTR